MAENPPKQLPLEFSTGNWIAFATLMLVGWMGMPDKDAQHNLPIESFYSDRPVITRIVDQTIQLPNFGISITPTDGWTYLRVSGRKSVHRDALRFVNESENLLASITPVVFKRWPPADATADEPENGRRENSVNNNIGQQDRHQTRRPKIDKNILPIQYEQIAIDWFTTIRYPYATHQYGRIDTGFQELLIEISSHPSMPRAQQTNAVTKLCNQIAPGI